MVSTSKVVEDGLEAPPRRADRRWGWLAAGVLIGIGGSILFRGADTGGPTNETTVPTTAPTEPVIEGTGEVIEGFPDGLVAAMRSDGRSLELAIWPLNGELYHRSITVGTSMPPSPVAFDSSGRLLATVVPSPGGDPGILYAGVPDSAVIIALGVTGYAWHDTAPTALAYTTREEEETLLWVTRRNLADSELVTRAVGIEGGVVAWGDWGYAVQDGDSVVLLTENGEIEDTHPGRFLASYATGWLAVQDERVSLLNAGGGTRSLDREGLRDDYTTGRFSRNGESLALLTRDGVSIVSLEEETGVVESGVEPGVPQVVWSSDNRFVLYPGGGGRGLRGIVVVDTEDFSVQQVVSSETLTGLGVVPSSGP